MSEAQKDQQAGSGGMNKLKVALTTMLAEQDHNLRFSARLISDDMKTFSAYAKSKVVHSFLV